MADLAEFRKMKDEFFKTHPQSPLSADNKKSFSGLNYFPENEALRFVLDLERYANPARVQMLTSRNEFKDYWQTGQVRFPVNGQEITLQVYESDDHPGIYFCPFVDATAPKETYGGGRYLEPERVGPDRLLFDLNLTYNPYCVYDKTRWNCPIPPAENRLKVRIEAGEKNYPSGTDLEPS
jgi:uncharacterized protein (DUF1684 family)